MYRPITIKPESRGIECSRTRSRVRSRAPRGAQPSWRSPVLAPAILWLSLLLPPALEGPAAGQETGGDISPAGSEPAREAAGEELPPLAIRAPAEPPGVEAPAEAGAAAGPELAPVPHPDLEPLEEQVAEQIRQYRDLTDSTLADPESTAAERAGAYGEMGRVYHAYGLHGAAEISYRNAIALAPGQPLWPYHLGLLLQSEGRFEEADAAFRRALELDPGYPPSYYRLAEVASAQGDTEGAREALDVYLEMEPESAAGWALAGQLALSGKDYERAVELLERALELLPRANRLHVPLALAYRQLGQAERAREHLALRGTIGARPQDPRVDGLEELKRGERVHMIRGRQAFQAGDVGAAVKAFGEAVNAAPESVPARVNLGTALSAAGDPQGALDQFRRALELEPDNPTARFNLGRLLLSRGQLEEAREHLEEAVRLAPDDGAAHQALGRLLAAAGEREEALPHLSRAVELTPASEAARVNEALVLLGLGRQRQALERLEEAFRLMPESGLIARELARLLASAREPELRDGERAVELARKVFDAQATVEHAALMAMALAEAGRCAEAAQWQARALEAARRLAGDELIPRLSADLERYRGGAPCRQPTGTGTEPGSEPE